MPGGDRTGPMGMGPMTGRAAGFCGGYGVPGDMNPIPGRGFGMGFGRGRGFGGRGWRRWFRATGLTGWQRAAASPAVAAAPTPEIEERMLQEQADALQAQLNEFRQRLDELNQAKR